VIKALIVDLDGVLRKWDRHSFPVFESEYGLPPGSMAAVAFHPDRLLPAITGRVGDDEWRAGIRAELAARHGQPGAAAVDAWSLTRGELDREVLELVGRQRPRRTVAVLTNATSRLAEDLDALGLPARVDAVFSSADLGLAKPDPAAFTQVCTALGVDPRECAFVDDTPANVSAAGDLGMRTHLYRTPAALTAFLDELP
jgi:putative hydrolase of the HAD superfamily